MPAPVPAHRPGGDGLGVLLTGGTGDPADWRDAPVRFAELDELGCSCIWLADHLFWGRPMPEALVMAAAAVATTSRCQVGTGVLQLPLRSSAAVAKAAATLQVMSGGRFLLGVGSGEHAEEYERAGADFEGRGTALDAAVGRMRTWWSEGEGGGRFAQRPSPGSVPVWVGGRSAPAVRRAAALGDGWLPVFLSPERYRSTNAELDVHLARSGRQPEDVTRGVVVLAAVTGPGWTRDDAGAWLADLWALPRGPIDRYLVTGDIEEVAAVLADYRGAGAGPIAVTLATNRPVEMFGALHPVFQSAVGTSIR